MRFCQISRGRTKTLPEALVSAVRDLLTDNGVKRREREGRKDRSVRAFGTSSCGRVQEKMMEGRTSPVMDLVIPGTLHPSSFTGVGVYFEHIYDLSKLTIS